MLLQQKGASSRAGALPGNGHAIDSTANHNRLEVFALQRLPICAREMHLGHGAHCSDREPSKYKFALIRGFGEGNLS
jgi:hypothetical protein